MLFSISLIILMALILSSIFEYFRIPGLIAKLLTGVVLGPYVFNLISPDILNISNEIRKIALIIILTRAGLSLDIRDLKKVGRPALLMCFVPAVFELTATTLLAPIFFNISYLEAAIMGTVLAAVSPAVVVPKMLKIMEKGYGQKNSIPQLIMAGASVDDIFVIVLFASFLGMYQGEAFSIMKVFMVPVSIIFGIILGIIGGYLLNRVFRYYHIRDTVKVKIVLSVTFLFVCLEAAIKSYFPISGLIAVMALGCTMLKLNENLAERLLSKYSKIWLGAEIFLFVLVGAAVDITQLSKAGLMAVLLIICALVFRVIGVNLSLAGTQLNFGERLFCSISYLPKATVQAAIGAIPLSAGVSSGSLILVVAVLGIVITAPLGAFGIDHTYKRVLDPPQKKIAKAV